MNTRTRVGLIVLVIASISIAATYLALRSHLRTDTYLGVTFRQPLGWTLAAIDLPDVKALYPNAKSELWYSPTTKTLFIVDSTSRLYNDDSRSEWRASTTRQVAKTTAVLSFGQCDDNSRPVIVVTFLVNQVSYSIHTIGDPTDRSFCSAVTKRAVPADLLRILDTLQINP